MAQTVDADLDPFTLAVVVVVNIAAIVVVVYWPQLTELLARLRPSSSEYGSQAYWTNRYTLRPSTFEWFGIGYKEMKKEMQEFIGKKSKNVLDIGCGTSTLVDEARQDGYQGLTGVDYCPQLIAQLRQRYPFSRFEAADCSDLRGAWGDGTAEGVVDKGTIDALLGNHTPADLARARAVVAEVVRVLAPGSHWVNVGITNPATFEAAVLGAGAGTLLTKVSASKQVSVVDGGQGAPHGINVYTQVFRR